MYKRGSQSQFVRASLVAFIVILLGIVFWLPASSTTLVPDPASSTNSSQEQAPSAKRKLTQTRVPKATREHKTYKRKLAKAKKKRNLQTNPIAESTLNTGCLVGRGPGLLGITGTAGGNPVNAAFSGVLVVDIQGTWVLAYCTDLFRPIAAGDCLNAGGSVSPQVNWLIQNYPPLGDLADDEAAARQAAVWYFTNGFIATDPRIQTRTQFIISQVPANPDPAALVPRMTISPEHAINILPIDTSHDFTISVTLGGQPVAGQVVDLTTDFGTLSTSSVTTDANGSASFSLTNTAGTAGVSNVNASFPYTLPAGTAMNPVDPSRQSLVIATTIQGQVAANAVKEWLPATTTPTSTPTNTPTATATDALTNTPTDTPTNTPVNTPTDTPTNTPTAIATFTATATPTTFCTGVITGTVFNDLNANGRQNSREPGIPSVTVVLYTTTFVPVASTVTGPDGVFLFDQGINGIYILVVVVPDGYQPTTATSFGIHDLDCTYVYASFGMAQPTPTPTNTFTPTITDTPTNTWTPTNTFTPTLTPTKTKEPTRTKEASRTPTHTEAPTKTPTVTKTLTKIMTPTNTRTPTNTKTPTTVPTKTPSPTPTPFVCVGHFDGYVYNDLNRNGIRDFGEPGINDARLTLKKWIGGSYDTVATTKSGTTGPAGYYRFVDMYEDSYLLIETPAPGYAPSPNSLHTWGVNLPCVTVTIDFGDIVP